MRKTTLGLFSHHFYPPPPPFHYALMKWVLCIVEKLKKQDGCSLKHLSVASPNPPGLSIAQRNSKSNADLLSLLINIWSIVEIIQNLHVSHSANPDELCSRSDDTVLTSLTQKYFSSFILEGQKPSPVGVQRETHKILWLIRKFHIILLCSAWLDKQSTCDLIRSPNHHHHFCLDVWMTLQWPLKYVPFLKC